MINRSYNTNIISFIIMLVIGMLFNPMNMLIYKLDDFYISLTLFYGGLLMAANMIWAHEIIHYISTGHYNILLLIIGLSLSVSITLILLRGQLLIDDTQWLKRMISHHSTAITTTTKIYNKTLNPELKTLATEIISTQEREIAQMKKMLKES